jgi:hypothetical protein
MYNETFIIDGLEEAGACVQYGMRKCSSQQTNEERHHRLLNNLSYKLEKASCKATTQKLGGTQKPFRQNVREKLP